MEKEQMVSSVCGIVVTYKENVFNKIVFDIWLSREIKLGFTSQQSQNMNENSNK